MSKVLPFDDTRYFDTSKLSMQYPALACTTEASQQAARTRVAWLVRRRQRKIVPVVFCLLKKSWKECFRWWKISGWHVVSFKGAWLSVHAYERTSPLRWTTTSDCGVDDTLCLPVRSCLIGHFLNAVLWLVGFRGRSFLTGVHVFKKGVLIDGIAWA